MSLQAIGKSRCASFVAPSAIRASSLIRVAAIALFAFGTPTLGVHADERSQAKRIHDRLAGVPASATELDALQQALDKDPLDAAYLAMEHSGFYNVTVIFARFSAPTWFTTAPEWPRYQAIAQRVTSTTKR